LRLPRFADKTPTMADLNAELLRAVELALADDWDAAHQIVQQHESDATAAWIHAVLHKMEGDKSNAHYWYNRADQMQHVADKPRAELTAIRSELGRRDASDSV
jgi:hypothetical protein